MVEPRFCAVILSCSLIAACSAAGESQEEGSGSGSGSGTGASSGHGGAGVGAGFNTGGGSGGLDACESIAAEAKPAYQPADIVFLIDTSPSMIQENQFVNENMNQFSQQIIDSGIDVHVVMLAASPLDLPVPTPGICVDAPLGSGSCPDDTNLPHYLHPAGWVVKSHDGLNVVQDSYPDWQSMMRQGASKSIVVVTDDDHTDSPYGGFSVSAQADEFIADFTAMDPVMFASWKMSGIYSFSDCASAQAVGKLWKEVIDKTGGLHGDLCQQQFQPIFDDLAQQIIVSAAQLECEWDIPDPPQGEMLDPGLVNVVFVDGSGAETNLGKVGSVAECDVSTGGWYYDDNANPTRVILCPTSCGQAQADPDGTIDVLFGCVTEVL